MPPYTTTPPWPSLTGRDGISTAPNTTIPEQVVEVVCAWPVSGQYGFGARIVYYILVATCIIARRTEWLRNACLTAALLLPAVAAIHAVVLAAVHVKTAVDMDIYGAFQVCSIGALAAPVTVYNSKTYYKTYFNNSGQNIMLLWTYLLLAGMLSLLVEFLRSESQSCPFDYVREPIAFSSLAACNLNCVYGQTGPFSPIRRDPTNEPAVIPVPQRLTFGAVTLIAAGSSIPPLLFLIFTWNKILETNWKRRFAPGEIEETSGTNPTTNFINQDIQKLFSTIGMPIFGVLIVVLTIFGELNFWSTQVSYQTEPISSIGQWANIVATVLVVFGSLYYVQKPRNTIEMEDLGPGQSQASISPETRSSSQSNRDQV